MCNKTLMLREDGTRLYSFRSTGEKKKNLAIPIQGNDAITAVYYFILVETQGGKKGKTPSPTLLV